MNEHLRDASDTPLNPPDPPADEFVAELAGREFPDEKDAVLDEDAVEVGRELTDTERYQGEPETGQTGRADLGTVASLEGLADRDLRAGETDDPNVAAEEGLTYVPPTDPPVIPSDAPEGVEVAAGMAASSLEEPYDLDHHSSALTTDDEMVSRVREALRADASTSELADRVGIEAIGGIVTLRGVVDDIDDSDNVSAVASVVTGVVEVVDRLVVSSL